MKTERKRIFISDLPETATEDNIGEAFGHYGQVCGVEIKERKELGPRNFSLFFCYVSLETDDQKLQKCFKDFTRGKWLGQQVELQLARESFLERIKREREENGDVNNENEIATTDSNKRFKPDNVIKILSNLKLDNIKSTPSLSLPLPSNSSSSPPPPPPKSSLVNSEPNEIIDYVIKSNKGKVRGDGIKIESVGKEPIYKPEVDLKNVVNSEANQKRLQSLKALKQNYRQQKSLIKAALSNVDGSSNRKIIFDADEDAFPTKRQRINDKRQNKPLFNDDEEDDEFEADFAVKEQFQGKEGQKLLELQSKYKNDKRFVLDKRFLDEDNNEDENIEENTEESLEGEKKKQLEILEEVLGKKVNTKPKNNESSIKMLRFDPSQPEHSKFEISKEVQKKDSKEVKINEKKQEEKDIPVVSKEVFYKVNEDIKNSLHESTTKGFSLLEMFGTANENDDTKDEEIQVSFENQRASVEVNPFKYDSSDDEQDDLKLEGITSEGNSEEKFLWTESFFFKEDDYRLQEGFDFLEKIKSNEDTNFVKLRHDLKNIVRIKIRNNKLKKGPFKKKLGGNKKKKMMRIKKALKK